MYAFEYTITDPIGLHARPAGELAKEVKKYASKVFLSKGDTRTDVFPPDGRDGDGRENRRVPSA